MLARRQCLQTCTQSSFLSVMLLFCFGMKGKSNLQNQVKSVDAIFFAAFIFEGCLEGSGVISVFLAKVNLLFSFSNSFLFFLPPGTERSQCCVDES